MKKYLVGFYYSLPIQLVLLHFKRYQVLLIVWYILFATIEGTFMQPFGASSLFLAPEYLGQVNALSFLIVGFTLGIFIMSWNIATFILHTKHIQFLATTAQPFLKFCINNAVIPVAFLVFYFIESVKYNYYRELISAFDITIFLTCFLLGLFLSILIAFFYFFGADKTIYKRFGSVILTANANYDVVSKRFPLPVSNNDVRVDWFLSAKLGLRKPRDVRHYSTDFLNTIFKRHHLAAILAIFLAFIFLLGVGFLSDNSIFQIPAAASITIFFAILIGVSAAFSLLFGNWTIPLLVVLYLVVNWMYQNNIIDPRNKAYGLNYQNESQRPSYDNQTIDSIASIENMEADKKAFIETLDKWKARQTAEKPVIFLIAVSGGGTRSATFTMNTLQKLDSATKGKLMPQTILISGASGGMLGATYFRALYLEKLKGMQIDLSNTKYVNDISKDLLNPLFSSFVARDLIGPAKKFEIDGYSYVKDRAYAFEQKLNENTHGILNKPIGYYKKPEEDALIPSIFFNAVISRDGRKMIISTRPQRYMMKAIVDSTKVINNDADGIDFTSFFKKQNPSNLRVLSAMRMNATFPYVLPNVWLPTEPVVDVMDAGLRDNFGMETSMRFINVFKDWLHNNTSKVVLINIRDRRLGDWDRPYETNSILSFLTKPLLLLQNNWFKLQDYYQTDQLDYLYDAFGPQFRRITFQYVPAKKDAVASLSFHLTASEKKDIADALNNSENKEAFYKVMQLLQQ